MSHVYRFIWETMDTDLINIVNEIFSGELSGLPKSDKDKIICKIHDRSGASIRQLERVLGIGKRIIEMALKCDK